MSGCNNLLKDLINAVIKSNIMILTNTPPEKKNIPITTKIELSTFIHNCYIESARIIYNNPYLFYHKYSLYDIKRNQRDTYSNIHNAINEAIRKMLPLSLILQEYLGTSFDNKIDQQIDNTMSDQNRNNLNKMINADISKKSDSYTLVKLPNKQNPNISGLHELKITDDKLEHKIISDKQEQKIISDKQEHKISDKQEQKIISDKQEKLNIISDNANNGIQKLKIEKLNNDSEAYYKKSNIEDSFSNVINKGNIFVNKFSDDILEMSNSDNLKKKDKNFIPKYIRFIKR